ncbi:unnamed protein product [Strongylus vulgaris]|uniref:Uncharacterized protein n=1 Tax=Strongylus vulgaris TaxID=40348 RepID=A0A3P7IU51_STRVU|nr:unnamed protein product [Strongylus vulgaris]
MSRNWQPTEGRSSTFNRRETRGAPLLLCSPRDQTNGMVAPGLEKPGRRTRRQRAAEARRNSGLTPHTHTNNNQSGEREREAAPSASDDSTSLRLRRAVSLRCGDGRTDTTSTFIRSLAALLSSAC